MRRFAMQINRVQMTRASYTEGRPSIPRLLVLHATGGYAPSDYNWLRKGGGIVNGRDVQVSINYYIDKAGKITQFVDDNDMAWHAGVSSWMVDGKRLTNLNPVALGIELSNNDSGTDPYPPAQVASAVALSHNLVTKYNIPQSQLVRHSDIAPTRKHDPAGFPWPAFVAAVYLHDPTAPLASTPPPHYKGRWRVLTPSWVRSAPWTKGPKAGRYLGTVAAGTIIDGELRMGEVLEHNEDWIAFDYQGRPAFVWSGQTERIA